MERGKGSTYRFYKPRIKRISLSKHGRVGLHGSLIKGNGL